jgi:ubiquinone/menaquinone biosynthesis C-methylase UbiE
VACDLSIDMLQQRKAIARTAAVVGAGEQLPFRDGAFDGMYSINVIEHVADVEA